MCLGCLDSHQKLSPFRQTFLCSRFSRNDSCTMLEIMKLSLYFTTLMLAVNAASHQRINLRSAFTCGPQGFKQHTNETIGLVPNVKIICPKMTVKMDTRTEIICEVISSTFANITWFYNGHPVNHKNKHKSHVKVDRRTCNQTLKIKSVKTTDGGSYTCQVANTVGNVTKTCPLVVKADESKQIHIEYLKIAGHRKKAYLQGSVNLTCNMLNVDAIMWRKNGGKIKSNRRHVWKLEHTFGGRGMMFYLKIANVTKSDEGLYTCIGWRNGRKANKTIFLQTEPCPHGYYCPYNGNRAIPYPPGTHANNSVPRGEIEDCFSPHQEEEPRIASVTNRGFSSHNPEHIMILLLVYTFMALYTA